MVLRHYNTDSMEKRNHIAVRIQSLFPECLECVSILLSKNHLTSSGKYIEYKSDRGSSIKVKPWILK